MAFWAIKIIASEPCNEISVLVDRLKKLSLMSGSSIVWEHPNDYHLTLKFLQLSPPPQLLGQMESLVQVALADEPHFTPVLQGLNQFERNGHPHVLWLGVDPTQHERLASLAARIDEALAQMAVPKEKRPFVPHITIGRPQKVTQLFSAGLKDYVFWQSEMSQQVNQIDYMTRKKKREASDALYESLLTLPLTKDATLL